MKLSGFFGHSLYVSFQNLGEVRLATVAAVTDGKLGFFKVLPALRVRTEVDFSRLVGLDGDSYEVILYTRSWALHQTRSISTKGLELGR